MAKVKAELEQSEWQLLLMLAGRGYTELGNKIANQLNAGLDVPQQPQPPGNGEDKDTERTVRQ